MKIYADNAATTKMSRTAIDAMIPFMEEHFGNPSSLYSIGQKAREALEQCRNEVAEVIGANPREIYFTSGGSEADNQALLTAAEIGKKQGKRHIISTACRCRSSARPKRSSCSGASARSSVPALRPRERIGPSRRQSCSS